MKIDTMVAIIKNHYQPKVRGRFSKKRRQRIKSEKKYMSTPFMLAVNTKNSFIEKMKKYEL